MPYEYVYVPAEVLVELEDCTVYFAYKDDNADDPMSYWYTTKADSDYQFDVRDFSAYDAEEDRKHKGEDTLFGSSRTYHAEVIKAAYLSGELDEYIILEGN